MTLTFSEVEVWSKSKRWCVTCWIYTNGVRHVMLIFWKCKVTQKGTISVIRVTWDLLKLAFRTYICIWSTLWFPNWKRKNLVLLLSFWEYWTKRTRDSFRGSKKAKLSCEELGASTCLPNLKCILGMRKKEFEVKDWTYPCFVGFRTSSSSRHAHFCRMRNLKKWNWCQERICLFYQCWGFP